MSQAEKVRRLVESINYDSADPADFRQKVLLVRDELFPRPLGKGDPFSELSDEGQQPARHKPRTALMEQAMRYTKKLSRS